MKQNIPGNHENEDADHKQGHGQDCKDASHAPQAVGESILLSQHLEPVPGASTHERYESMVTLAIRSTSPTARHSELEGRSQCRDDSWQHGSNSNPLRRQAV